MNQLQYRNLYQLKSSWKINSYLNFQLMIKTTRKRKTIELTIGDIACFVKPHSVLFVIPLSGILPKRHNGLESPTVFVLVTDNKFDFYNITGIADKKYMILDKVLKRIIVTKSFHNLSISSLFNNRFKKGFRKIQIKIIDYNR